MFLYITGGLIFLWFSGFAWFIATIEMMSENYLQFTDSVVVFTGSPGRLYEGVKIINLGLSNYMLVTGVNESTLNSTRDWLKSHTEKYHCCIELGTMAKDTTGNARETVQWINRNKFHSIRLVTAKYHISRSLIELRRHASSDLLIVKHPVEDKRYNSTKYFKKFSSIFMLAKEYSKYLISLLKYYMLV